MKKLIFAVLVVLVTALPAIAQDKDKKQKWGEWNVKRGADVVLKIPMEALRVEKYMYIAVIEQTEGGLTVNGHLDWRTMGFPSLLQKNVLGKSVQTDKDASDKNAKMATVVLSNFLRSENIALIFKQSVLDIDTALKEVVFFGKASSPEVEAYLQSSYQHFADLWFTGALSAIPKDKQIDLIKLARKIGGAPKMGIEEYKGKKYFVFDIGRIDTVYNTLKLNQNARTALLVNENLLNAFKTISALFANSDAVDGVKAAAKIPFKSFADEYVSPEIDSLEIYAPLSLIRKFSESEITSQQLIDGSVVLVNSNRIQLSLSQS